MPEQTQAPPTQSNEETHATPQIPPTLSPRESLPRLLSGDLLGLFHKAAECGPIIRLDGAFFHLYQVNDVALIKRVLRDKEKRYRKGKLMRSLKVVTGDGLLINDGELWRRHRRLANPAFTPRKLDGYAECMLESAEVLLQQWRDKDAPIDLLHDMSEVTLLSLLQTIFGVHFDEAYTDVSEVIHELLDAVVKRGRSLFPLPLSFPTPTNIQFRRKIGEVNGVLEGIINARRQSMARESESHPVDLLGQWLQEQSANTEAEGPENNAGFSPQEMRDELMTMLIAGHHSLAIALAWSLYEIARHPEIQQAWHREVDNLTTFPTSHKALDQLPYTKGIFLEALRFYPQPPILLRDAMEAHTLGPYAIKEGDQLLLNAFAVHQDPECWPEPEAFQPERYHGITGDVAMQHHYLSFGGGARTCIGRRFAILEGCLLLARIAQHFEISLVSDQPVLPKFSAMMVPQTPLQIRVQPRR